MSEQERKIRNYCEIIKAMMGRQKCDRLRLKLFRDYLKLFDQLKAIKEAEKCAAN